MAVVVRSVNIQNKVQNYCRAQFLPIQIVPNAVVARSAYPQTCTNTFNGTNYSDKNGTRPRWWWFGGCCSLEPESPARSESPPLRASTAYHRRYGNTYRCRDTALTRTNPNKIRISAIFLQATTAITYHWFMIWPIQRARAEEFVIVPVGLHSLFPICSAVSGYPLWYKRGTKMFFFRWHSVNTCNDGLCHLVYFSAPPVSFHCTPQFHQLHAKFEPSINVLPS